MIYILEKGFNFTEIALGYGHGQSLALFENALSQSSVDREDVFVTHALYRRDLPTLETINEDVAGFYRVMQTNYADSTLVTQALVISYGEDVIYPLLHDLLNSGKTRYVSLSNAGPKWIEKFSNEFGDSFFAHEGHLSFEVRALQDAGVFKRCDELDVKNIIWRPLRRNPQSLLQSQLRSGLTEKYDKTASQIILNWMSSLGYSPMVFSTNKDHIDENFEATQFEMLPEEYLQLTNFRPPNYSPQPIDWDGEFIGNRIVDAIKDFD